MRGCRLSACLSLMALLAIGCGGGTKLPELGTVTGVVTVNGKPVEGLTVTFEPKGSRPSTGVTDSEGHYSLLFNKNTAGAVVGSHTVRISQEVSAEIPEKDQVRIPRSYNTASTLKRDVKAGKNTFDFKIVTKRTR